MLTSCRLCGGNAHLIDGKNCKPCLTVIVKATDYPIAEPSAGALKAEQEEPCRPAKTHCSEDQDHPLVS